MKHGKMHKKEFNGLIYIQEMSLDCWKSYELKRLNYRKVKIEIQFLEKINLIPSETTKHPRILIITTTRSTYLLQSHKYKKKVYAIIFFYIEV